VVTGLRICAAHAWTFPAPERGHASSPRYAITVSANYPLSSPALRLRRPSRRAVPSPRRRHGWLFLFNWIANRWALRARGRA